MTTQTTPETRLALAKIARFGRRRYVGPALVHSLTLQQHDGRDLAALVPEVAEAVRAVDALAPNGRGWGDTGRASVADRRADHSARMQRLGELLDLHYPGRVA